MSITREEREILNIFEHFRITSGTGLMQQNMISMLPKLSPIISNKADELISSLIQKGYINHIPENNFFVLTELGENELYGTFNIDDGLAEFMGIFSHFRVTKGTGLMLNNIQSYIANNNLSPMNTKNIELIMQHAVDNGFILDNGNQFYILTEKGEKTIY
jgi:predicted transcriptional regulator